MFQVGPPKKCQALDSLIENPTNASAAPTAWTCGDAPGQRWCEQYGYDPRGNRSIAARLGYGANMRGEPGAFDAKNRMAGAWGYDGRGNVRKNLLAPTPETFVYDAENRIVRHCTSAADATDVGGMSCTAATGSGRTLYSYDAEGRRVKQERGSTTHFIYDAFGQLAAEYGTAAATQTTQYLTSDHLGTTRVVSDGDKARKCQDYLPFGAEITVSTGDLRAPSGCYGQDLDVRLKFTGKERDPESGLDYFGARYFSGAQGRWISPDWSAVPEPIPYADTKYPQSLNLYGYVRNNPSSTFDPDGHCGLVGDQPCSLQDFVASLPDRLIAGLKGEANALMPAFIPRFKPSNAEQADVMVNVEELTPVLQTGIAMAIPGPKLPIKEASTMRAGHREAMRNLEIEIPTSQQPSKQTNTPAGRQYEYEVKTPGGGAETKLVQRNNGTDRSHPGQLHVEAGNPKPGGQTDLIGRPRLQNDKVKVNVKSPNAK